MLEKLEVKLKKSFLKKFSAIFMISSVGKLTILFAKNSRPSIWDILGEIPTISVVTRIPPSVFYNVFLLSLLAANDDLRIPKRFL